MKTKSIDYLTERELGWLMLRKLCQLYDAGGISSGRSFQSRLLDAWILLDKVPEIINMDDWSAWQLFEEAEKRKKRRRYAQNLEPFSKEAKKLSKRQFGYCVLSSLAEWYIAERAKYLEDARPYRYELDSLKLALEMIYAISFDRQALHHFDATELIREGDNRFRAKVKRNWKRRV